MICYLVRHGKDDETVRGGWSDASLCEEGITQVNKLALQLTQDLNLHIGCIYSSDLMRARQTAEILNGALHATVKFCPQFREVNNGMLAGMKNSLACEKFPGLYWSSLNWEDPYPNGESPREFYERIVSAWNEFKDHVCNLPYNVMLVTHGGVINVIQCIEHGIIYSNKCNPYPAGYAEMIAIEI